VWALAASGSFVIELLRKKFFRHGYRKYEFPQTEGQNLNRADRRLTPPILTRTTKTIVVTALISTALTALVMGFVPFIFGLVRGDLKAQIVNEINQTLVRINRDIVDLTTQIAVLKNFVENLEKFSAIGRLKVQAAKLGITDPQITSVDLKPQATFTAVYSQPDRPSSFVRLDYNIEEVGKDTITIAVHATMFDRGKLWDQFGPLRQKIQLARKTFTFRFTGKTSDGKKFPFLPFELRSSTATKRIIILRLPPVYPLNLPRSEPGPSLLHLLLNLAAQFVKLFYDSCLRVWTYLWMSSSVLSLSLRGSLVSADFTALARYVIGKAFGRSYSRSAARN